MSECAICEKETVTNEKLCSVCGFHDIGEQLLSDHGLLRIRSDLGKAPGSESYLPADWNIIDGGLMISSCALGSPAAGPCQTLLPKVVM